jgi:hypothetical protein
MLTWINMGEQPDYLKVAAVEERYAKRTEGACKFVAMLTIKTRGGWSEEPAAVFWQEKTTDPAHSNYFGLVVQNNTLMICNGSSVAEGTWAGMLDPVSGEIVFSRYRHDYRQTRSGKVTVDGGRDYFKGGGGRPVELKFDGPMMVVVSGLDDAEVP